jgi:hypothetical protein
MNVKKRPSLLACAVLLATMPGRAELLEIDLSIFGMD